MKPRTLMRMLPSAVAAATVFCAATANASHDPRYRHGAQCIDQATNRITLPCNDDSTDPIHFTREQAQAWVARKKKEKADAAKAATDAAIAANNCGTGQVRLGGLCRNLKDELPEAAPQCATDQVLSGGFCVPLPPQASPQCEPASRTTNIDSLPNETWGTPTVVTPTYECGTHRNPKTCNGEPYIAYPAEITEVITFGSCQGSRLLTAEYTGDWRWYFTKSFVFHCPSGMEAKDVISGVRGNTDQILTYCVTK